MGASKKCVLSAGKTHVHKIPPFRGGGVFWVLGGGGVPILFLWARGFFRQKSAPRHVPHLVNLFLTNLVRISGFSSLFLAIAVLSALFAREC